MPRLQADVDTVKSTLAEQLRRASDLQRQVEASIIVIPGDAGFERKLRDADRAVSTWEDYVSDLLPKLVDTPHISEEFRTAIHNASADAWTDSGDRLQARVEAAITWIGSLAARVELFDPYTDQSEEDPQGVQSIEDNVQAYVDAFRTEYVRMLEGHHKDIIDQARAEDRLDESFPLYAQETTPRCFLYDYGAWIVFTRLKESRVLTEYGSAAYTRDWAQIYTSDQRNHTILSLLSVGVDDVVETVIVEGTDFLSHSDRVTENAVSHARSRAQSHIARFLNATARRRSRIPHLLQSLSVKRLGIMLTILFLGFCLGVLVANTDRFSRVSKLSFFGLEMEFGDKKQEGVPNEQTKSDTTTR